MELSIRSWVRYWGVNRGKRLTKAELSEDGQYYVYHGSKDTPLGKYTQFNVKGNTTIVVNTGGIGGVKFCADDFWCSDGSFWIGHSELLNDKYVYYFLSPLEPYFASQKRVGGVPTIDRSVVENVEIPVPPLPVQEEIVRILDNFTELQAELQAELQKRLQQYEYYRDKLLSFSDLSNWGGQEVSVEWKKLGEIATFTYGYTAKAEECGEVRYIRITDINDGGCLIPDNGKYISYTQDTEPYLLKKGDLVMARTGATYGKTLYYNEDYLSAYASFLIKINLQDLVNPRFYWHFSKSNLYWEQARKLVGGGAQPQFNTGAISQIVIPIPPLTEQQRIVEVLDRFDTLTNDITAGLPAEIEARRKQYEYYRDQLLTFKQKA